MIVQPTKEGEYMEMQLVKSSMLHSMAHDPETNTLIVKFKEDGPEYDYADVPASEYSKLVQAESVGKHFGTHIRNNFKGVKRQPKKETEVNA